MEGAVSQVYILQLGCRRGLGLIINLHGMWKGLYHTFTVYNWDVEGGCITSSQPTVGKGKGAVSQVYSIQLVCERELYHKFTSYNWDVEGGCITNVHEMWKGLYHPFTVYNWDVEGGCITSSQPTVGKGAVSQVYSIQLVCERGLCHKFISYNWDVEGGCITNVHGMWKGLYHKFTA